MTTRPTPRLELLGITKAYPGVVANSDVSLTLAAGEIHAVLGENGAGKSTLMKIIYGAVQPDSGTIRINGNAVEIRNPHMARALGIGMVFQHFNLFDTMTVAENVWLGLEGQTLDQVTQSIVERATEYGLDIDPQRPIHTLSVGEMQRVEIIRALLTRPSVLILDEPTSVLTPQAVEKLFVVLRKLASEGCSILYISHKLHEIRSLCTACTVLRGGKVTGVCNPQEESNASLSRFMIGAEPPKLERTAKSAGSVVMTVRALSMEKEDQFGVDLDDIHLDLHAGEILGIAGVSGNGQKELLLALSGENVNAPRDSIQLCEWGAQGGIDLSPLHPGERRKLGLHFVPEDRLGRGAVPTLGLAHNLLLTRTDAVTMPHWGGGWLRLRHLKEHAQRLIAQFNVKTHGPQAAARSLSGGNLQKFIVGREVEAKPKLLILSQPTWGVDVGAAAQIRAEILALRDQGCAILVVSEELEELFEICDRLHVISSGKLSPSLPIEAATVEQIGEWMSGLWNRT